MVEQLVRSVVDPGDDGPAEVHAAAPPPPAPPPPPPTTPPRPTANPELAAQPYRGLFDDDAGGGEPLAADLRGRAEASLGASLAGVRVHRGAGATALLADRGVAALTVGPNIAVGADIDDTSPILAHEIAHAAAQAGATGPGGDAPAVDGTRERDADLGAIAILSGVAHRMAPMAAHAEQHYASNEHVWLGDAAAGGQRFKIGEVTLTSGEVNALADYFGSLQAMEANPEELAACLALLRQEERDPGSVPTSKWDEVTHGEYSRLAQANGNHFGASNPDVLPSSGSRAPTNASTWESGHVHALRLAAFQGEAQLVEARLTNAFAEHFLCDAFSAGHLFNKADAMAIGRNNLAALDEDRVNALLDTVADPVFAQNRDVIREYQINVPYLGWTTPNWYLFRQFVHEANAARPDLLLNALVRTAHDDLSDGGVMVENDAHGPWLMRGDAHLADPDQAPTQQYCMEALEAGRANVEEAVGQGARADFDGMVARVHGLFPRPTADAGVGRVRDSVNDVMDPDAGMVAALTLRMNEDIRTIMDSAAHDRPEQVRRDPRLPDGGHDAPEPHLPDPLPTGKYYIVEEGDWLSKIAEKFYADPMTYPILFDANNDPETAEERHTDVIADPDEIDVGWRLFIPDLPAAPAEPPGDPSGQKPTY